MYTKCDLIKVHDALHDINKDRAIISGGRQLLITKARNGCRKADIYDFGILMQQNVKKSSSYARRARKGERLSWFIPNNTEDWKLITDKGEEI